MSLNNKIVCIIDDDPGTTIFFHEALKSIPGINISTFTDPIAALEHFQVNDYAYVLVISDYKMPGLNGIKLLEKIKDSNRFVRTILTTAFEIDDIKDDDNLFQEYIEKRIIDGYLQKPISIHQLLKEVTIQLDCYEAQKNSVSNG